MAQNPAYRPRLYRARLLQSLLPDFYLGAETSSPAGLPPRPPIQEAGARAPIFVDDFRSGLTHWSPELQSGGIVAAENGVLNIDVPVGATIRIKISVVGNQVRYYSDEQLVFDYIDPEPYRSGWFAFRTVASHFAIRDFGVWRPAP